MLRQQTYKVTKGEKTIYAAGTGAVEPALAGPALAGTASASTNCQYFAILYGACRISGVTGKNLRYCAIFQRILLIICVCVRFAPAFVVNNTRFLAKIAHNRKFLPVTPEILHAPYNIANFRHESCKTAISQHARPRLAVGQGAVHCPTWAPSYGTEGAAKKPRKMSEIDDCERLFDHFSFVAKQLWSSTCGFVNRKSVECAQVVHNRQSRSFLPRKWRRHALRRPLVMRSECVKLYVPLTHVHQAAARRPSWPHLLCRSSNVSTRGGCRVTGVQAAAMFSDRLTSKIN